MLAKPTYRRVGGGMSLWFAEDVCEDSYKRCLPKTLLQSCLVKALLKKVFFSEGDVGEVTEDGGEAPHAKVLEKAMLM